MTCSIIICLHLIMRICFEITFLFLEVMRSFLLNSLSLIWLLPQWKQCNVSDHRKCFTRSVWFLLYYISRTHHLIIIEEWNHASIIIYVFVSRFMTLLSMSVRKHGHVLVNRCVLLTAYEQTIDIFHKLI